MTHRKALAMREALARESPEEQRHVVELVRLRNNLAWLLLVSADPDGHRDREARDLAQKAVDGTSEPGPWKNTLGVAHYRVGSWAEAVTVLNESAETDGGRHSFDWFFLAMANWQLGNKTEAREYYFKAVQWMEENDPGHDELKRFRAEAEELMGFERGEASEG